jgi:hypothetical protein
MKNDARTIDLKVWTASIHGMHARVAFTLRCRGAFVRHRRGQVP